MSLSSSPSPSPSPSAGPDDAEQAVARSVNEPGPGPGSVAAASAGLGLPSRSSLSSSSSPSRLTLDPRPSLITPLLSMSMPSLTPLRFTPPFSTDRSPPPSAHNAPHSRLSVTSPDLRSGTATLQLTELPLGVDPSAPTAAKSRLNAYLVELVRNSIRITDDFGDVCRAKVEEKDRVISELQTQLDHLRRLHESSQVSNSHPSRSAPSNLDAETSVIASGSTQLAHTSHDFSLALSVRDERIALLTQQAVQLRSATAREMLATEQAKKEHALQSERHSNALASYRAFNAAIWAFLLILCLCSILSCWYLRDVVVPQACHLTVPFLSHLGQQQFTRPDNACYQLASQEARREAMQNCQQDRSSLMAELRLCLANTDELMTQSFHHHEQCDDHEYEHAHDQHAHELSVSYQFSDCPECIPSPPCPSLLCPLCQLPSDLEISNISKSLNPDDPDVLFLLSQSKAEIISQLFDARMHLKENRQWEFVYKLSSAHCLENTTDVGVLLTNPSAVNSAPDLDVSLVRQINEQASLSDVSETVEHMAQDSLVLRENGCCAALSGTGELSQFNLTDENEALRSLVQQLKSNELLLSISLKNASAFAEEAFDEVTACSLEKSALIAQLSNSFENNHQCQESLIEVQTNLSTSQQSLVDVQSDLTSSHESVSKLQSKLTIVQEAFDMKDKEFLALSQASLACPYNDVPVHSLDGSPELALLRNKSGPLAFGNETSGKSCTVNTVAFDELSSRFVAQEAAHMSTLDDLRAQLAKKELSLLELHDRDSNNQAAIATCLQNNTNLQAGKDGYEALVAKEQHSLADCEHLVQRQNDTLRECETRIMHLDSVQVKLLDRLESLESLHTTSSLTEMTGNSHEIINSFTSIPTVIGLHGHTNESSFPDVKDHPCNCGRQSDRINANESWNTDVVLVPTSLLQEESFSLARGVADGNASMTLLYPSCEVFTHCATEVETIALKDEIDILRGSLNDCIHNETVLNTQLSSIRTELDNQINATRLCVEQNDSKNIIPSCLVPPNTEELSDHIMVNTSAPMSFADFVDYSRPIYLRMLPGVPLPIAFEHFSEWTSRARLALLCVVVLLDLLLFQLVMFFRHRLYTTFIMVVWLVAATICYNWFHYFVAVLCAGNALLSLMVIVKPQFRFCLCRTRCCLQRKQSLASKKTAPLPALQNGNTVKPFVSSTKDLRYVDASSSSTLLLGDNNSIEEKTQRGHLSKSVIMTPPCHLSFSSKLNETISPPAALSLSSSASTETHNVLHAMSDTYSPFMPPVLSSNSQHNIITPPMTSSLTKPGYIRLPTMTHRLEVAQTAVEPDVYSSSDFNDNNDVETAGISTDYDLFDSTPLSSSFRSSASSSLPPRLQDGKEIASMSDFSPAIRPLMPQQQATVAFNLPGNIINRRPIVDINDV